MLGLGRVCIRTEALLKIDTGVKFCGFFPVQSTYLSVSVSIKTVIKN